MLSLVDTTRLLVQGKHVPTSVGLHTYRWVYERGLPRALEDAVGVPGFTAGSEEGWQIWRGRAEYDEDFHEISSDDDDSASTAPP